MKFIFKDQRINLIFNDFKEIDLTQLQDSNKQKENIDLLISDINNYFLKTD